MSVNFRRNSFSKIQLLIFALVFASISGYAIFRTFADIPGLLHSNNTLISFKNDSKTYLIEDGKLRLASEAAYQSRGLTSYDIRIGTEADAKLPGGTPLPLAEGATVKDGDKLYQIVESDGIIRKRLIENNSRLEQLNSPTASNLKVDKSQLPKDSLNPIKRLNGDETHPEGTLILSGNGVNYLIKDGQRRPVNSPTIGFTNRLYAKPITAESEGDKNLPVGAPLTFREGSVIKGSGPTKYVIEKISGRSSNESFVKRPIRSQEAFLSLGYNDKEVVEVSDSELNDLRSGRPLPASTQAPIRVGVIAKPGENTKKLSDEYVQRGAKVNHLFSTWFSLEIPYSLSEELKKNDSRVKIVGDAQISYVCDVDCEEPPLPPPPPPPPPVDPPPQPPPPPPDPAAPQPEIYHWVFLSGNTWEYGVRNASRCEVHVQGVGVQPFTPTLNSINNVSAGNGGAQGQLKCWNGGTGPAESAFTGPTPAPPPPTKVTNCDGAPGVYVYENSYYTGRCSKFTADASSLGDWFIGNDAVSSIKFVNGSSNTWEAVLFANTNYSGSSAKFTENDPDPTYWPVGNDAASSITIKSIAIPPPPPPPDPNAPQPEIYHWEFISGNTWQYGVNNASKCEVHIDGGGIQPFTPTLGSISTVTAGNGNKAGQLKCWNGGTGPAVSAFAGPAAPKPAPPPANSPTIFHWEFISGNSWQYGVSRASRCEVHLQGGGVQPFNPTLDSISTVTAGNGGAQGQLKCWNGSVGPVSSAFTGPSAPPPPPPPPPPAGYPPLPDQNPTIQGTAKQGRTLNADPGYWKNGVNSFAYRWHRCTGVDFLGYGTGCSTISGATSRSYVASSTDVNLRLAIRVTATNSAGSVAAFSKATAVVGPAGSSSTGGTVSSTPTGTLPPGTKVTLKWNMSPAPSCLVYSQPAFPGWNNTTKPGVGTEVVTVTKTTYFSWSCRINATTIWLRDHLVTIAAQPPPPPPAGSPSPVITSFESVQGNSVASGTAVTLNWGSTGATSCTGGSSPANGQWNGARQTTGSQPVGVLTATTTFTLSCTGNNKSTSKQLTVAVTAAPTPTPTPRPPTPPTPPAADAFTQNSPHLRRINWGNRGAGIPVAVVDSGVERHPLLNVANGHNCVAGDTSPATQDDHGHGTAVAGVIGASGNGTSTPVGVAPGTQIVPVKAVTSNGKATAVDQACGINWAADNGIRIINLSLEGPTNDEDNSSCGANVVHQAICYAVNAKGVLVVAAAGNSGTGFSAIYPATYAEVLTVTAMIDTNGRPPSVSGAAALRCNTGVDDTAAPYSNFANGGESSVSAPGCVFTTVRGGGQDTSNGTSMAAPMVAGVAALLNGARPNTSADPAYYFDTGGRNYGPLLRF